MQKQQRCKYGVALKAWVEKSKGGGQEIPTNIFRFIRFDSINTRVNNSGGRVSNSL